MADLKKQEKMYEQRIAGINSKYNLSNLCVAENNSGLYEQTSKLKAEIQNLKKENQRK